MIKANTTPKIIIVFLVCFLCITSLIRQAPAEEIVEYKRQNVEEEQKRYIIRLHEDKKKVDLAIVNTKILIDRSRNRPYLPELYLRLAELYIEKSRIVYFLRRSERSGKKSALDQFESNTMKNQALEIYQRTLDNFPKFEDRDKVHFFMAHEFRELSRFNEMVQHYRIIITKHKDSPYAPEAFLLLGDYFINKEDLELAKRHYKAVLDYPTSQAVVIARYKLAWCHINNADYKNAITLFEEAVTSAMPSKELDIDTYKRVDIKLESLIDMAFCYTERYKKSTPQQALAYFQKYAWSRQVYMVVLEKLAYRYLLKKKYLHAAEIYRQLATLQHDTEKLLEYSRNIFECVQTLGTFKNADQDMAFIIKALGKQKYSIHIPQKEKEKNHKDYELYARDLATHLHQKARRGKSPSDFKGAADAYRLYLEFFDKSPVRTEMASNYAEALFSSKQYLEAGKQYETLAGNISTKNEKKKEKLYSAVISYYNAIKEKEDLSYYQTAFARDGLKTAGKQYAADYPWSRHVPDVLFNVAWISYDAGNYDEAIKDFTQFIDTYPTGKPTKAAVHLVLDSYNLKEDSDGLIAFGKSILQNKKITDKKLRAEVAQIVQGTESKVVSSMTIAAMDDWEKGKTDLLEFADQSKSSSMGEQALNAVIISSKEKGDLVTLLTAGETLIKKYPSSDKVESTLGEMIDASLRASQFRLLGNYLESYADRLPQHANTRSFLYQAGNIRQNLSQYKRSNNNYRRVLNRPSKDLRQREEIVFSMVDNYESLSDANSAINILTQNHGSLSRAGKVRADALVADLYLNKEKYTSALKYRKRAYQKYKSSLARKDGRLNTAMAQMTYNAVHRQSGKYFSLQLKNKIDNKIVADKSKLLDKLEKGYQSVMAYQSPDWALIACYRSYEINREFARFLKNSPMPKGLTADQKKQYTELISQKADGYSGKAAQYLDTCIQQARKWEICNPLLAGYFNTPTDSKKIKPFESFSGSGSSAVVAAGSLKDEDLIKLHETLMKTPDDTAALTALSEAYIKKGDYRLALLITQKTLNESKSKKGRSAARLYNNLGISHLYTGNDAFAKDALKKALLADTGNIGAKVNLAGLLTYYGHKENAHLLYRSLPDPGKVSAAGDIMHPRAREFYYAQQQKKEKKK